MFKTKTIRVSIIPRRLRLKLKIWVGKILLFPFSLFVINVVTVSLFLKSEFIKEIVILHWNLRL